VPVAADAIETLLSLDAFTGIEIDDDTIAVVAHLPDGTTITIDREDAS
jgi:hypothetical protein